MFKGYIPMKGKKPLEKYKDKKDFCTLDHVRQRYEDYGGVLEDDVIQIDVDDAEQAKIIYKIVSDNNTLCNVLQTTRGMHFYFKNTDITTRKVHSKTPIGIIIDVGIGSKNAVVPLKVDGKLRKWLKKVDVLSPLPAWLRPMKNVPDFTNLKEGDGRNQTFFNYILTLQADGYSKDSVRNIINLINNYVLKEPLKQRELDVILRDEAFKKIPFYRGATFLHHNFANYLKNEARVVKINNILHVYKEGVYVSRQQDIEAAMIQLLPGLTKSKRLEVLAYLEIICENIKPASVNYIAVGNGILDINDMTLKEYNPDIVLQNKINYNYKPETYDKTVDNTLNKICCKDNDLRLLLEEIIGYLLLRRNEIGKCFILTGSGRNGKSTFLDMLKQFVGINNYSSLALDEIGQRFKTAEMFGKLANIGDDISNRYIDDNAVFKKIVTGETVNVERKGRDPFDFNNYAKLIFSANELPRINDTSDGLMRRLIIVPFKATFSKSDPDYDVFIKDKLLTNAAMEYLLKLAVDGLKRVLQNGFTEPEVVARETTEYEAINNPVVAFVQEVGLDSILNQPTKEVHLRYSTWCIESRLKPLSVGQFSIEMCRKFNLNTNGRPRIDGMQVRIFKRN